MRKRRTRELTHENSHTRTHTRNPHTKFTHETHTRSSHTKLTRETHTQELTHETHTRNSYTKLTYETHTRNSRTKLTHETQTQNSHTKRTHDSMCATNTRMDTLCICPAQARGAGVAHDGPWGLANQTLTLPCSHEQQFACLPRSFMKSCILTRPLEEGCGGLTPRVCKQSSNAGVTH